MGHAHVDDKMKFKNMKTNIWWILVNSANRHLNVV